MKSRDHSGRASRAPRLATILLSAVAVGVAISTFAAAGSAAPRAAVRTWTIHYTAHNGSDRLASVMLPAWYGPAKNPPLPVIISPHGRNGTGRSNTKYFGDLPAIGKFAVISPDGMGRRLGRKSYAYAGQIDDLAKMPEIAEQALPWLRLDRTRVYAIGSSMGGHETLMLIARYPKLLAGAAALDSVTHLARRYDQLPTTDLQSAMRTEVGGTPTQRPAAYKARSPLANAAAIARAGVPLQIWWSTKDKVVIDQQHQSGTLFRTLRTLGPAAPLSVYIGRWPHSKEMKSDQLLPIVLEELDLLGSTTTKLPATVTHMTVSVAEV
jgi:poly(3-hydroxybutyrate) depolymerase